MSETELSPDPVLLAARDQARAALAEITDPAMIGAEVGHEIEDAHVLTLLFECRLAGYPGWRWAATLARTSEDAPVTVLEVELLPGPDSVIAPDWVPWSERLAQYREGHSKQSAESSDDGDDGDELEDTGDDLANDFEDDLDGVDLDEADDDFDGEAGAGDADDDGDDDPDEDDADEDIDDDADDTELFDEDSDDVDDDEDADDDSEDDSEGDSEEE
ncbi:DUF3027 domain-containing protein [Leucobacter sp. USCH14]|uniref:DUF3027 domain-containing protein n=1 Tax=Leucobacter sp. USCH14 TaxID=3024838 RepID=UPI0030B273A5